MNVYRIRANGARMYIQKRLYFFKYPLWWFNLCDDGYSVGEYNFIKYYTDLKEANQAIDTFCENDRIRDANNAPYETIKEVTCKENVQELREKKVKK